MLATGTRNQVIATFQASQTLLRILISYVEQYTEEVVCQEYAYDDEICAYVNYGWQYLELFVNTKGVIRLQYIDENDSESFYSITMDGAPATVDDIEFIQPEDLEYALNSEENFY